MLYSCAMAQYVKGTVLNGLEERKEKKSLRKGKSGFCMYTFKFRVCTFIVFKEIYEIDVKRDINKK